MFQAGVDRGNGEGFVRAARAGGLENHDVVAGGEITGACGWTAGRVPIDGEWRRGSSHRGDKGRLRTGVRDIHDAEAVVVE